MLPRDATLPEGSPSRFVFKFNARAQAANGSSTVPRRESGRSTSASSSIFSVLTEITSTMKYRFLRRDLDHRRHAAVATPCEMPSWMAALRRPAVERHARSEAACRR